MTFLGAVVVVVVLACLIVEEVGICTLARARFHCDQRMISLMKIDS